MLKFIFSRTFVINVLLAGVFVILCLVGAYYFLNSYAKTGEAVSVPDLAGYDLIEAEAFLKEAELDIEIIDSIFTLGKRGGEVVDQDPRPSSLVKKNRKIYLTISRYETPKVSIPNVLNQTSAIAISKLTRRGFEIGELISKADPCEGCAIGLQLNGETVEVESKLPQGSKIDIVFGEVNAGSVTPVPELYGLSFDEATALLHMKGLNRAGFSIELAENEGDSLASRVFWQSEKPGELIKTGSPIIINLSTDITKVPPSNIDSVRASLKGS